MGLCQMRSYRSRREISRVERCFIILVSSGFPPGLDFNAVAHEPDLGTASESAVGAVTCLKRGQRTAALRAARWRAKNQLRMAVADALSFHWSVAGVAVRQRL